MFYYSSSTSFSFLPLFASIQCPLPPSVQHASYGGNFQPHHSLGSCWWMRGTKGIGILLEPQLQLVRLCIVRTELWLGAGPPPPPPQTSSRRSRSWSWALTNLDKNQTFPSCWTKLNVLTHELNGNLMKLGIHHLGTAAATNFCKQTHP